MEARHEAYLHTLVDEIDKHLLQYVQALSETRRQTKLFEGMRYSLEAGGKRIRPVLVLEFCRLCGGTHEQAMAAACALEMVHTYSLVHDDLPEMDDDDFRRGRPSCHKKFGHAEAVLIGDALSTAAFGVLADDSVSVLDAETKVKMVHILAEAAGAAGMVGGQIMDMAFETRTDVTLAELEAMCAGKTGALIRAACCLGVVAGHATNEQIAWADSYGEKLGLAFQIVDDILDVTGTTETLGKPVGSDVQEGKTTFVTLLGLVEAKQRAAQLTEQALQILQQFSDAAFLADLTKELLIRKK